MPSSQIPPSAVVVAALVVLGTQLSAGPAGAQPAEDQPADAETTEPAPEEAQAPDPSAAEPGEPPRDSQSGTGVAATAEVTGSAEGSVSAGPPPSPSPPTPPEPPEPPEPPPPPYDGPPTLLGSKQVHVGGYGGPAISYTRVLDSHGVLVGGEAALLVDHRLAIGGAGYGLVNRVRGPDAADGTESRLQMGYGGLMVRYHVLTGTLVYFSAGTLIGAGGVAFTEYDGTDWDDEDFDHDENSFFVLEPALGVHMNLTRWARLSLTAAYRVVNGVETRGLDDSDISGPSFGANMQFGWL